MKQILKSFFYALRGIWFTLKNERNFQIECAVGGAVFLLLLWLPLTSAERAILLFSIGSVLSLELVNTALERVMDILKPRVHPYAKVIKDVMAGAVLIVSCTAVLVGIVIFFPYFFSLNMFF